MRTPAPKSVPAGVSVNVRVLSLVLILLPAVILGLSAAVYQSPVLAAGAGVSLCGGMLVIRAVPVWHPPASGLLILVYLMALGWFWVGAPYPADQPTRLIRGTFLLVAVALLICHDLNRTGLGPRFKAMQICRRILKRQQWPATPEECARLSEVRHLRDAVVNDPRPALDLLHDYRPQVRLVALLALQGRSNWRPEETAVLTTAARSAVEPAVRAAAVAALARANDARALATLSGFLRDPNMEVRAAAISSLFVDSARNWPLIRDEIRNTLASPGLVGDDPLIGAAGRLPAVAVCDLTTWAAEQPPLATRAIRALVDHYGAELASGDYPGLPMQLAQQVIDASAPPALRVELAGLLRSLNLIPAEVLDRMTDADQPGPIRILAAETMISADVNNAEALDVLRGLGRQPNRETALTIARLLQQYLGMDMGLPSGTIEPNSKAAVEAARRVLQWATGRPLPTVAAIQGQVLPGLKQTVVPPPSAGPRSLRSPL